MGQPASVVTIRFSIDIDATEVNRFDIPRSEIANTLRAAVVTAANHIEFSDDIFSRAGHAHLARTITVEDSK